MKANKVTVKLKVEMLSIDSLQGLLSEASNLIRQETHNGKLRKDDGDEISWKTKTEKVEF